MARMNSANSSTDSRGILASRACGTAPRFLLDIETGGGRAFSSAAISTGCDRKPVARVMEADLLTSIGFVDLVDFAEEAARSLEVWRASSPVLVLLMPDCRLRGEPYTRISESPSLVVDMVLTSISRIFSGVSVYWMVSSL